MALAQEQNQYTATHINRPTLAFRLDVALHNLLMNSTRRTRLEPQGKTLPEPVYPQREYSNTPIKSLDDTES